MADMLKEKLNDELRDSLKSGTTEKTGVLRFLLAQLHNREIEKRSTGQAPVLSDDEIIEVFQREVKKRKEAIELFKKGGRQELVQKEERELAVINEYLPASLNREELENIIAELQQQGFHDFNSLMKQGMKKVKGRADGALMSEIVRGKL